MSKDINWKTQIGRLRIRFSYRRSDSLWGRFGGGWQWALGFRAGGKTVLFNLLVAELIFSWVDRAPKV